MSSVQAFAGFFVIQLAAFVLASSNFQFPHVPQSGCPAGSSLDLTFHFGAIRLQGGDNFFRHDGRQSNSTTMKCSSSAESKGVDVLGEFVEREFTWLDGVASPRFVTAIRSYSSLNAVVLSQRFPDGLTNAATGDADAVITGFPSWALENPSSQASPSFVHFSGYMAGNYPQYGLWESGWKGVWLDGGIANSGVVSIFDPATGDGVAVSPFNEFMSASIEVRRDAASEAATAHWGIMGNVSTIPAGFEAKFLLVGISAGGVNGAVRLWGETLRAWYNKPDQLAARERDVTLQRLGYSTDNGAFYYYYTGNNAKNYQELVGHIKAYAEAAALPYGYIQFDSWWYYRADGNDKSGVPLGGVTNWTAMTNIFPNELPFVFSNVTQGWPVMAHNRYWATNNVYAANPLTPIGPSDYHGATFNFTWGIEAGLPTSTAFWDNLFSINNNWGLAVYEQDWLCTTMDHMPVLKQQVQVGGDWLRQMGQGALKHNLTVQYCMSYPRHVLQSVEILSVTQARASNDFQPQTQIFDYDQWRIGESSLWVAALGICPSKDSFWTMPNSQFDPHYDPIFNDSETRNRLESVSSTMSNGVVQISDRIGYSNRSLILMSCMENGTLLYPDFSASPSESCFASRALGASNLSARGSFAPCGAFTGAVHGTLSHHVGYGVFFYVLSVSMQSSYQLQMRDICTSWGYKTNCGQSTLSATWLAYEANSTHHLRIVNASSPLTLAVSDEYTFEYFTLAPVPRSVAARGSGVVLLGEKAKWISASSRRISSIVSSTIDGGIVVQVLAAPREQVTLLVAVYPTLSVVEAACQADSNGHATMTISASGSTTCAPLTLTQNP